MKKLVLLVVLFVCVVFYLWLNKVTEKEKTTNNPIPPWLNNN